jgi:hypothetical protein
MGGPGVPETGWYRTESGAVLEMDHPLLDGVAHRVKTGEITRVMNAGTKTKPRWIPYQAPGADSDTSQDDISPEHQTALDRVAELETALAEAGVALKAIKESTGKRISDLEMQLGDAQAQLLTASEENATLKAAAEATEAKQGKAKAKP